MQCETGVGISWIVFWENILSIIGWPDSAGISGFSSKLIKNVFIKFFHNLLGKRELLHDGMGFNDKFW